MVKPKKFPIQKNIKNKNKIILIERDDFCNLK